MCKKSFAQGLVMGLIVALILMFLYNPIAACICVLALYLLKSSKNMRRNKFLRPNFSSITQHGASLVVITAIVSVFLLNPTTALLGLALPFVGISYFRRQR